MLEIEIETISDFKQQYNNLPNNIFQVLLTRQMNHISQEIQKVLGLICPPNVDYCQSDNPYKERYGSDWRDCIIKSITSMKLYTCIAFLVDHDIEEEPKRVMKGTVYEDNYYYYHDALTLMTAKATKEYMVSKTFFMTTKTYGPIVIGRLGIPPSYAVLTAA